MRVLTITALALGCAAASTASACGMRYVGEVPLVIQGGGMSIPVRVNNATERMHIALTSENVADAAFAQRVHLTPLTETGSNISSQDHETSEGHMDLKDMTASVLSVGGAGVTNANFAVDYSGHPLVGPLIGGEMFERYDVDFDVKGGRLAMYAAAPGCHGEPPLAGQLYTAGLIYQDGFEPVIQLLVNGKTVHAAIDGYGTSTMTRDLARKLGLTPVTQGNPPRPYVGAAVEIAGIRVRDYGFRLVDSQGSERDYSVKIGIALFANTHVWLSRSTRKLVLQYPALPSPPPTK